jgi:hypothetical protein
MRLFSYEEFTDIHTCASKEGCSFDDALHRCLIVAVRKFLEYHNLKSDLVTEKNLADDALQSYKKKWQLWHSHEATCRVVLFNLNYTVAHLSLPQQTQEEQRAGSRQGEPLYGPSRPGKYAFPDPKCPRTSYIPLPRTCTPPKQAYPNLFGKPFKPTETGNYASPESEHPNNSGGSFKPAGTGKYAFPEPEYPNTTPHSSRDPRYWYKEFRGTDTSPHWEPRHYSSTYTAKPNTSSYTKQSTSTNHPPPRASSSWHPSDDEYADFSSYRPRTPPLPARSNGSPDFYKVLGVSRVATAAEIKTAYHKLSLKHHPDRVGGAGKAKATVKMAEINQAHDVLGDEEGRRYYDITGRIKK